MRAKGVGVAGNAHDARASCALDGLAASANSRLSHALASL